MEGLAGGVQDPEVASGHVPVHLTRDPVARHVGTEEEAAVKKKGNEQIMSPKKEPDPVPAPKPKKQCKRCRGNGWYMNGPDRVTCQSCYGLGEI